MEEDRPFLEGAYGPNHEHMTFATAKDWIDYWVPYEWNHVICTCVNPGNDNDTSHFERVCTKCGKFERWQLYRGCAVCRQTFFSRFKHHKRVNTGSVDCMTCFNCLTNKYGSHPDDVPPVAEPRQLKSLSDFLSDFDNEEDLDFTF